MSPATLQSHTQILHMYEKTKLKHGSSGSGGSAMLPEYCATVQRTMNQKKPTDVHCGQHIHTSRPLAACTLLLYDQESANDCMQGINSVRCEEKDNKFSHKMTAMTTYVMTTLRSCTSQALYDFSTYFSNSQSIQSVICEVTTYT